MPGTRDDWDALSGEEQSAEQDSFHDANMTGTIDNLYSFDIMLTDYFF
jgi:hypothetical protein